MAEFLKQVISSFRFADFLDIFVVSVFIFFTLTWIRRRASRSLIIAIGSVVILYISARLLNMYLTSQFFQAGLTAALVALVIIFQDDIRMFIEHLASMGTRHSKRQLLASNRTVELIVDSVSNLAKDRIGALIVIKGRESLERHLSGGISVNGRISVPLLYSIFHPETPMHDGAAILEGDRIDKFAVRLPLSHNLAEVGEAGTRHTAALGISERSDSLVLVVSEERGTISIAESGHLEIVDKENLRLRIDTFYNRIIPQPHKEQRRFKLTADARLKLISVLSAMILWLVFANRIENVSRTYTMPVEFRNVPSDWVIENPKPEEVKISLSGQERAFNFDHNTLVASFDLANLHEGYQSVPITEKNMNLPKDLAVSEISPENFTFHAYRTEYIELPVTVKTKGRLPVYLELMEIKPIPSSIKLIIPSSRKNQPVKLTTEPVDLSALKHSTILRLRVITPAGAELIDENQQWVKVNVNIRQK